MGVSFPDKLFEPRQFFPARAFAAGFGDFAKTVRDIFEREWLCGLIFGARNFSGYEERPRADVERARMGRGNRRAGQKRDAKPDPVGLEPFKIFRCRSNLREPARRFLELVA